MTKYDLRYSKNAAVGDNPIAINTVINGATQEPGGLRGLIEELTLIQKNIEQVEQKTKEDYLLLADIVGIKGLAEKGDEKATINELVKKASDLFYSFSMNVGSGIVANIIYSAITK